MSDNKKYYYLKLKDDFFDSDSLIVLESMQDGYLYSNILLKLYLRSLKNKGRLNLMTLYLSLTSKQKRLCQKMQ